MTFRFVTQIDTGDSLAADRPADDDFRGRRRQDLQLRHQILRRPEPRQGGARHRDARSRRASRSRSTSPRRRASNCRPTQFPTQHLVELIDKAEKGETFYETSLFDGSEDADKVMTTTVIVGKHEQRRRRPIPNCRRLQAGSARTTTGRSTSPISTKSQEGRRGTAGIPHQLQAARERPDPRPRDGLWRLLDEGQARRPVAVRARPKACTE